MSKHYKEDDDIKENCLENLYNLTNADTGFGPGEYGAPTLNASKNDLR